MSERIDRMGPGGVFAAVSAIAVGAVVVWAVVGLVGCDADGEQRRKKGRMGNKGMMDEQMPPGGDEEEEAGEKPGGTASISHGGITSVSDDPKLVQKGKKMFKQKGCPACHKMHQRQVGPALAGVTDRREPQWIARMILHPQKMLATDPTAKKLLAEFGSRMTNQNLEPEEARAIIAYLGSVEPKEGATGPLEGQ